MPQLSRLWVGMQTRSDNNSGTDSRIVLIVNDDGFDRLHHTFEDTSQEDQERKHGNVYEVDVSADGIAPERLNNSSVRVGIRGADLWRPQHFVVWGEQAVDAAVVPLALETDLRVELSTDHRVDKDKGNLSFPLRLVGQGSSSMKIRRLLVMTTTADTANAGTRSPILLDINFGGGRTWSYQIVGSGDGDIGSIPRRDKIGKGDATFDLFQGVIQFEPPDPSHPTRDNIDSIVLRVEGNDQWEPAGLFVFGVDVFDSRSRPNLLIPLVNIPNWDLGKLSSDPDDEGAPSVTVPLAPIDEVSPRPRLTCRSVTTILTRMFRKT